MLRAQPVEHLPGGVALPARAPVVLLEPLTGELGGTENCGNFRTLSREIPSCLAAARSLIPLARRAYPAIQLPGMNHLALPVAGKGHIVRKSCSAAAGPCHDGDA